MCKNIKNQTTANKAQYIPQLQDVQTIFTNMQHTGGKRKYENSVMHAKQLMSKIKRGFQAMYKDNLYSAL